MCTGIGWRKLHISAKKVQIQCNAWVWYISNIVLFLLGSQWLDDWGKIQANTRQDTGGNIKKTGHLGQDLINMQETKVR